MNWFCVTSWWKLDKSISQMTKGYNGNVMWCLLLLCFCLLWQLYQYSSVCMCVCSLQFPKHHVRNSSVREACLWGALHHFLPRQEVGRTCQCSTQRSSTQVRALLSRIAFFCLYVVCVCGTSAKCQFVCVCVYLQVSGQACQVLCPVAQSSADCWSTLTLSTMTQRTCECSNTCADTVLCSTSDFYPSSSSSSYPHLFHSSVPVFSFSPPS